MPTNLDVHEPQGWTDARRTLRPDKRVYTVWPITRNAFARDAGLRTDHLTLSPRIAKRLKAFAVDRHVRAREEPSDHAPVWIEIVPDAMRASEKVHGSGPSI